VEDFLGTGKIFGFSTDIKGGCQTIDGDQGEKRNGRLICHGKTKSSASASGVKRREGRIGFVLCVFTEKKPNQRT